MDDELITREDALNAINRIWDKCEEIEAHLPEGDPDKTGYKMIADYLTIWKYLSAKLEIIYCKDCKHLQKWRSEKSVKKFGQIYECARNVLDCPKPEDFCSKAERRNDD